MAYLKGWLNRQAVRYYGSIALSACLSLGGVVYAICVPEQVGDGGRGGALGVATAFLILFFRKNLGETAYRAAIDKPPTLVGEISKIIENEINNVVDAKRPPDLSPAELTRFVIGINNRFSIEAREQTSQNVALAIASVIGTIVWGFGDWFAYDLRHHYLEVLWLLEYSFINSF